MAKQKTYKLGIVADLSPNGSIHQQTFIRAVNAAAEDMDFAGKGIELVWENDFAKEDGGTASSKILVKKGVQCVVGHFASAAARGALPQYERRSIPLLLPASTADALTANFHSALRICSKDSDLAIFIISMLKKKKIFSLFIDHDGSVHGQSLAGDLVSRMSKDKKFSLHRNIPDAQDVIFVGSYTKSIAFVQQLQHTPGKVKRVFFTDDAVHDGLAAELSGCGFKITVFGFDDRADNKKTAACIRSYEKKWGSKPNTYYLETYTAMQVAAQLFEKAAMAGSTDLREQAYLYRWNTVLGNFRFTPEGENSMKHFAVWLPAKNKLKKEKQAVKSQRV